MSERNEVGRRSVLKTVGGITAASVLGGTATAPALAAHEDDETPVRVNQVGYPVDEAKRAIVTSATADVSGLDSFEVVDADSGETVTSGSLSEAVTDELTDKSTGHSIKWADFSDLSESGTYRVVVGDHESRPFEVGEPSEVYGDVLADVGRLYTIKRANTHIDDPETGLDIGPGHMQDEEAIVQEPETSDFLNDYEPGDTIDVTGGWYDAGDYGKYVITHTVAASQMLLAYERNPEAFSVGQFNIPDSVDDPNVGEMPDVLAEARYGLQFLEKMQRPDGALFFKVAKSGPDEAFPGMEVAPSEVDADRYVLGLSSAATAMAVGTFALAARVFREYGDDDYADTMLERAENGFEWLQENPDTVWEQSMYQDSASGTYGRQPLGDDADGQEDAAERYWAAAELLRTTGDSTYDDYIQNDLPQYESYDGAVEIPSSTGYRGPVSWNTTISLGHYAYAHTDGADADVAESVVTGVTWNSQRIANGTDAYGTGVYDFYWSWVNAGVSRATQMSWAADLGSDTDYTWAPLHYALGRSATGYSYVTGHGEKSTENPHDRIIQSQNMDDPIPGMLVSGPHANIWNENGELQYDGPLGDHITQETPHQLSYVDDHGSYVVNEWAIDYTAPLFFALAEIPGMTASEDDDDDDDGDDEESQVAIELASSNVSPDGSAMADVVLSDAPAGVSGYEVTVEVADPSVATITGANFDDTPLQTVGEEPSPSDDGASITVQAADLSESVQDGAADVELVEVGLQAQSAGETAVSVSVGNLDDDDGEEVSVATTGDTLVVATESLPTVGDSESAPTDPDGDGQYEDLNGNGEVDYDDVVLYFQHREDPAIADNVDAYDYNGNDDIDFDDVVQLFKERSSAE
ncbi:glycoside hydrolase family 9 protein [Halomicrobium salinisoli]|uniref:glycoside hydrolase family 9 protein n=1 Tax=Halomicrobium salinisoli TaxID=2878391 RepID=UPI001CF0983D|nr:glycoside hydrolase family 9 protein [Halomicrobium salinisoli]